ncbi:MAG: hypothetical protein M3Y22_06920 [Pseudomonadota bacterium]|nr:hypothetical protein [Pseudomonadota bacterium]
MTREPGDRPARVALARLMGLARREALRLGDERAAGVASVTAAGRLCVRLAAGADRSRGRPGLVARRPGYTEMQTRSSLNGGFAWPFAFAATALFGTLASACMMPFVAIAVATAATMNRRQAIVTILGIWAINQMLGFGLMGFPLTRYALSWGLALGVGSMVAMLVASRILATGPALGVRLPIAFLAAFAVYEGGLFVFALVAGGTGTFTAPIVLSILSNDAMWFTGLVALHLMLARTAPKLFGASFAPRPA